MSNLALARAIRSGPILPCWATPRRALSHDGSRARSEPNCLIICLAVYWSWRTN